MRRHAALIAALLAAPALADRPVAGGPGGGGPRESTPCVTPEWRAALHAFVSAYLAADPAADCDASGALNIDDIDCFVAAFLGGCG